MSAPIRLGLVGIGKIARDQHVPALAANPRFELVATASRHAGLPDLPGYRDIAELLAADHPLDAVSICTPPLGRHVIARAAIAAGKHVMLEKPPGATTAEVAVLADCAARAGVTLFTSWHSREAATVDAARDWLAARRIEAVRIAWREDIRKWHPGQDWIMAAGGFGVFDPAINALSIATRVLPEALLVDSAELDVPENREAPIAARVAMHHGDAPVTVTLDFLQTGPQTWDIEVDTDRGTLRMTMGGKTLAIPGDPVIDGVDEEYPRLYRRFAELIEAGESDVDWRPLQLVADAFLIGRWRQVAPFDF